MQPKTYRLWDFIAVTFRAAPVLVCLSFLFALLGGLVEPGLTLTQAAFIDAAVARIGGQAAVIWWPFAATLVLTAWGYINYNLDGLLNARIRNRLAETLKVRLLDKRARLAYRHIENNETMDLIGRVCRKPEEQFFEGFKILLSVSGTVVQIVSLLAILMAHVWWTGPAVIALTVPLAMLAVRLGRRSYEADKEADKHTRRPDYLSTVLTEREGAEERAVFGTTKALNERWYERYRKAMRINLAETRYNFVLIKSTGLIIVALGAAILLVLLIPLRDGRISLGLFASLSASIFSLGQMLSWNVPWAMRMLEKQRQYLKDLTGFEALSEIEGAADLPARLPDGFALGQIEFDHVSFRYPGTENYILRDFTFTLREGAHYALVGANGAGKTTLTKLLTGQYDEYEGTIRVAGRNLRDFTAAEKKALFSVVYQDYAKYYVTLREAVALGDLCEGARPDVESALRAVELDTAKLPQGIDTPLGKIREGGVDLSGGEWQRTALARCLVSPAPVRILDEPTAALDPMAESRVYEQFGHISEGHTTLFITHRLGAARLADEILVLADGHVAEHGSHEALMRAAGLYAEMFESQSAWYREEASA